MCVTISSPSHTILVVKRFGKGREKREKRLMNVERQVFLNIVLDDAVEEKAGGEKVRIGMVVRQSKIKFRNLSLRGFGVAWCG